MKIAIATDAWHPQVNGVVRSIAKTKDGLEAAGHDILMVTPERFRTIPCPTYPEIRLALGARRAIARMLDRYRPDVVHISTEGPIGWAVRRWCIRNKRAFTTCFHTRFPDYVAVRTGIPEKWIWPMMRRFHNAAERTFVATPTLEAELTARGIRNVHIWPRGVDLTQFGPRKPFHPAMKDLAGPILLNVGRVAPEKNLEAFLSLDTAGSKVIVGDGPALADLKERFPDAVFLGALHGEELASAYASADLFVFPSRTDTFGLVIIEAMASGLPVAAFPVAGPQDILGPGDCGMHGGTASVGALDERLDRAIARALWADPAACISEARYYSWERCTEQFLDGLERPEPPVVAPLAA